MVSRSSSDLRGGVWVDGMSGRGKGEHRGATRMQQRADGRSGVTKNDQVGFWVFSYFSRVSCELWDAGLRSTKGERGRLPLRRSF